MRRVWASLVAVWATLAIVAALAWSHPMQSAAPQTTQRVLVNGPRGVRRVVLLPGTTAHTTTHSSTVAAR